MNEEEKQAMEFLKTHIIPLYKEGKIELLVNETILNLIEKQENKYNRLLDAYEKRVSEIINYEENSISINKIDDKIKEYQEILSSTIIDDEYKIEVNNIIRVLRELKENNLRDDKIGKDQ